MFLRKKEEQLKENAKCEAFIVYEYLVKSFRISNAFLFTQIAM